MTNIGGDNFVNPKYWWGHVPTMYIQSYAHATMHKLEDTARVYPQKTRG